MLTTQSAVLAAASKFPVEIHVNARGKDHGDVCCDASQVNAFLKKAGFRNSIDKATVKQVN